MSAKSNKTSLGNCLINIAQEEKLIAQLEKQESNMFCTKKDITKLIRGAKIRIMANRAEINKVLKVV